LASSCALLPRPIPTYIAYVSIRQHTSAAYGSIHQQSYAAPCCYAQSLHIYIHTYIHIYIHIYIYIYIYIHICIYIYIYIYIYILRPHTLVA
jgi:hypothetical protein